MNPVDMIILILGILLPLLFLFRNSLPFIGGKPRAAAVSSGPGKRAAGGDIEGDPRDFVAKMEKGNKRCVVFYGTQTGTAEEYSIRLAKEAKSRYGISSLVCDPEDYEFNKLDRVPEGNIVVFVLATYGEGDPTDNMQAMWDFLMEESVEFSQSDRLENLNYVIFGLGNRTYEHFNGAARVLDARLAALGATRVGARGEGDDDKALEEDYLEWKDPMFEEFAKILGVEEGGAGDVADFAIKEIDEVDAAKVYHGELSPRALKASASGTNTPVGSYDSKNPYPSPVRVARELFSVGADRNCVHVEFDTTGTGITYQHGDHAGVWPSNPDLETERFLAILGLSDKRHIAVEIESLDPALAKVPFPTPATYEAIFRHYLDISAKASRQTLAFLARYAPTEEAKAKLTRWGSDKAAFAAEIDGAALKLGETLQAAAGDSLLPPFNNTTVWQIPFDRIISTVPRLQPRYYSISSSSKLYPQSIHITAVVLKYQSKPSIAHEQQPRWVYGISTNFILNIHQAGDKEPKFGGLAGGESAITLNGIDTVGTPSYKIAGPRNHHFRNSVYRIPIHVRRSTFRLPTSPKVPVIMIGPGTGVAPFRGFVQERIDLARKAKAKNGPDALKDWAPIYLFYGCRNSDQDFLYKEEWPEYEKELDGKFIMLNAFSRGEKRKPDGSKIYVQDLIWEQREALTPLILEKRAYIYICGEAKNMAKAVEERLCQMLAAAKGGTPEVEGAKEVKLLKDRNRFMTDVWS